MLYLCLLLFVFSATFYLAIKGGEESVVFMVIFFFVLLVAPFASYTNHADNLGTIKAQYHVIEVQNQRLSSLKASLQEALKNDAKMALLNADSPIKAIVDQIAEAEKDLAKAKTVKAEAEVSIAKRKIGLFKFVTWLF